MEKSRNEKSKREAIETNNKYVADFDDVGEHLGAHFVLGNLSRM